MRTQKNEHYKKKKKNVAVCYMMILPTLIGFALFSLYPIAWALRYALCDYDGITSTFTGLSNFVRLFTRDTTYWMALLNTFMLTFGKLAIEIPLALLLAVLLNGKLAGKGAFRTVFFLPNIISVAIMGLIFSIMFDAMDGCVNTWLMMLHITNHPVNWFSSKWTAMSVIAIASIWQGFGVNMLFFLSGIQGIPHDLYESAEIDGATKRQSFFHITIPMLAPVLQVVFMLAMVGTMQTTDLVLVLTNGNPAGKTEVIMTYIFKYFFNYGNGTVVPQYGYATAASIVFAMILGVFTMMYFKITKKKSEIY